jgi:NADPH:quinone reductase-like Zn-dependent oxidoreductase
MRAVVHERYGPPETLRIADVERPVPKEGELLVRVHASTVTRGDTELRTNAYGFLRPVTGVRRPRQRIAGTEFAGRVEEVGPGVTQFRLGDDVFGVKTGANAEYVTVRATGTVARKPPGLSYEEAAALSDGASIALSILQTLLPLEGRRVLVYGAAGSIGTAVVQLAARHFGAKVTAVCDTRDLELVRTLGADAVLDRFRDDFTGGGEAYDVVFDAVGKESFGRSRRALVPGGVYVSTGSPGGFFRLLAVWIGTRFVGKKRGRIGIGRYRREDLTLIGELAEAGTYRPVVDRIFDLDDVVEANRYVESGQKSGNVVLRITATEGR